MKTISYQLKTYHGFNNIFKTVEDCPFPECHGTTKTNTGRDQ